MQAVVLTIHLLLALALILVVLLQRSEGGGLGIGGGGVMTSRGAATALSKVTWAIGIAFVVTSMALTVLAARDSRTGSVIDTGIVTGSPTPAAPAAPGLEGDLLPQALPGQGQPAAEPAAPATPAPAAGGDGPAAPPPVQ
jgi:preprotein translocase subunit SecG